MFSWIQVSTFQERKDIQFLSHIKFIHAYKHYIMIAKLKVLWVEKLKLGKSRQKKSIQGLISFKNKHNTKMQL